MKEVISHLKPDAKGRIYLGELAKGISSFKVSLDEQHRLILEPYVEIPLKESWIMNHPERMAQLKQGIQEALQPLHDLGSFQEHLEEINE